MKIDASGNRVWDRKFGGSPGNCGRSVQETNDGGYIIAGSTGSSAYDVWLIKTDASGDTAWSRTFGGIGDDIASSVQQTRDGGYIIAGHTESYGAGGQDVWLIKTDAEGRVDSLGGK
jgi:predicted secreted protein